MERRRILFIMQVDWRFVKQRHHFLAEGLAERHELLAVYRFHNLRRWRVRNASHVSRVPMLPIPRRFGRLSEILDERAQRVWLWLISRVFRPDLIWITSPVQYAYLPRRLKRSQIIYDCLDDSRAFFSGGRARREALVEADLLDKARRVLVPSEALRQRLLERNVSTKKLLLVRNGISSRWVSRAIHASRNRPDASSRTAAAPGSLQVNVAYVGAVAPWIDYESLISCLEAYRNLRIHLVGPEVEVSLQPHPRLIRHGLVEHTSLAKRMEQFDAFILPFLMTPLTSVVDPVKLYEYLSVGRPVLAVRYPEIERFERFLYFYSSLPELEGLIERLLRNDLPLKAEQSETVAFLEQNTWANRLGLIDPIIDELSGQTSQPGTTH